MFENENSIIDELIASYENNNNRDEWQAREERRVELFKLLQPSAYRKLNEAIKQQIVDGSYSMNEMLNDLLIFTDFNIDSLLKFWLENSEVNLSSYLFRGAGRQTEELLFEIFNEDFSDNTLLALEYLPWCSSDNALNQFVEWKKRPPKWNRRLHAPIEEYPEVAGWELDDNNDKRLLYSPLCHALNIAFIPTDELTSDKCPLCARPFIRLQLVPNVIADVIPGAAANGTVYMPFCNLCCRFNLGSISVLKDGKIKIDTENIYKDTVPDWIKEDNKLSGDLILKKDAQSRDPYFAAPEGSKYRHSQLGGFPTWIQHPKHQKCPTCTKRMFFFMQYEEEEEVFSDYRIATFHFFFCTQCKDRFYVKQQFT